MNKDKVKAFIRKAYGDMAGAMTAGMAYVGVKTGLFRAMAGKGPMGLDDVVKASGLETRYVEEWLCGMASAAFIDYDPDGQTFELPDEHAYLLASEGTDHFMGGLFCMTPILMRTAPKVAEAFKTGGGVAFQDFGPDAVAALDMINGGQYTNRFESYWLKALPGVAAKLESGGRTLDVGCGVGRVCIALAKALPGCDIVGLDPDAESIRQARLAAAEAGVEERIRFIAQTTGDLEAGDKFDLITACDCVHDFSAPEQTLGEIAALLKPDGTLFIVEPKIADRLEDNMNSIATVYYGFSIFHCMTQSLADGGPGLGTCMGPARLESLLRKTGFDRFEQLDIKSQTHLFYAAGL